MFGRTLAVLLTALTLPIGSYTFSLKPMKASVFEKQSRTVLFSAKNPPSSSDGLSQQDIEPSAGVPSRRGFLSTISSSIALTALATSLPAIAQEGKKILVLGGTGLVGSEVCRQLRSQGIDVVATSRDGRDGTVALDVTKSGINIATEVERLSKGCSAVISTIGAIGTSNDGVINAASGMAAAGAKAAGVQHFVYIGVAPEVREFAKGIDFLQDYMAGKAFSEESIQSYFGNSKDVSYTLIEPTFIYGGDKFGVNPPRVASGYGKIVESLLSSALVRATAGIAPEGFIKIALEPPVPVEDVAGAAIAGAFGRAPPVLDTYDEIVDSAKLSLQAT